MNIRIGFGYDVHQLASGEDLWLGGIKLEHYKGTIAHSDGDALIHAICDALLGAAGLRDIGFHFPDTSGEFKNIDSKILLQRTVDFISQHGFSLINMDATICLQKPKVKDHIPLMQATLAPILKVTIAEVSIKATTTEKLGFVGTEDGIACYAVVLLNKM